jgi:para-aminobenzoate synthetase component I
LKNRKAIQKQMNQLGSIGQPFVFLIDFLMEHPQIFPFNDLSGKIKWQIHNLGNPDLFSQIPALKQWNIHPVTYEVYRKGFDLVQQHIHNGDTFLLNYTQPTLVETNLTLDEIFQISVAPYKILLKNRFVCFSPESFVKIENGKISSFPMKGTIDADITNAEKMIISDSKELGEHNTVVDLIRNDISMVADNVTVEKFRYLDHIYTNQKDLLQVSSKITGDLPPNYPEIIGDIIFTMLPAGSISGAPKKKTVDIILEAENYNRGYYTGVFGIFNGKNLDSCVLIRFIENQKGQLVYKSGGGITFMSRPETEYQELINKIYVPIS